MDVRSVITEPSALLTVRHVTVHGDQRHIGRPLAAAAEAAHGDGVRPRPIDPDLERVRRRWFELHHPALAARGRGVAEHFGIATDDLSFPLDVLGTLSWRPACSVTFHPGASMSDGHPAARPQHGLPHDHVQRVPGPPAVPGRAGGRRRPVDRRAPSRRRPRVDLHRLRRRDGRHGRDQRRRPRRRPARRQRAAAARANGRSAGWAVGGPGRALPPRHVRHRRRGQGCAASGEALLPGPAVPLRRRRPQRGVVRVEHSRTATASRALVEASAGQGDRLVCTNHLLHRWPDATGLSDDEDEAGTAVRTYARWPRSPQPRVASSRATRWASSSPPCGWSRRPGTRRSGTPCTTSPRPPPSSASSSATTAPRAPTARRSSSPSVPADRPIDQRCPPIGGHHDHPARQAIGRYLAPPRSPSWVTHRDAPGPSRRHRPDT